MNNPLSNGSSSSNLPMFNMGSTYRKNSISDNANATKDKMEEFFKFIKITKLKNQMKQIVTNLAPIGQIRRCIMLALFGFNNGNDQSNINKIFKRKNYSKYNTS